MKSAIRKSMTGVVLLLAVIAMAMVPTAASATDQFFMQVAGIPGTITRAAGGNWMDVLAFSGNAVAPSTQKNKTSTTPCSISVSKYVDISSPRLWAATATGQIITSVELQAVKIGNGAAAGAEFVFYDVLLTNAQITSISDGGSTADGTPTENLSFQASNVTLTSTPQNADGTAGTPVTTSFPCN